MSPEPSETPMVRRARDYHLFDPRGRRHLDLWLNGGRALLGHRPPGLGTTLKNQLSRGLLAEAPSIHDRRLEKSLAGLVPGSWSLRVYRSFDRALGAVGVFLGRPLEEKDIREPFFGPAPEEAVYFRPLAEADYSGFSVLLPILPFPGAFAPQPVFFACSPDREKNLLPGDPVSPFLAAGLHRASLELQKRGSSPDIWNDWSLPGWKRFGPYCFPEEEADYPELRSRLLAAGVIISPDPKRPSILPGIWSPGEKALVERLCSAKS